MMEHRAELAKLQKEISRHFDRAKELAKRCSFWNDAGILDALVSNDEVSGHKSPLRDNAVFPELPVDLFRQMSRQALFAAIALLARYGKKEDFASWLNKSQMSIKVSDLPTYAIDLSSLKNPCDIWVSLMRGYLALANHRLLTKDRICRKLFGVEGDICTYEGSRVQRLTAESLRRYEWLKTVSPLPYRLEAPSQGPAHRLCSYYGPIAKSQAAKSELCKILSFGYSLYLLSRIHRIQKPNQTLTFLSPAAIFSNLFDVSFGLPGPTDEEQLLGTDTAQPLYHRACQSVRKLLGLPLISPDSVSEQEIRALFRRFVFNPMIYRDPFVTLPYDSVILQATADGCVFFDDVGALIPAFVAEKLLETGKLRNLQGEAFRSQVEKIVRSNDLIPFRVSTVKRNGKIIGDVDVGFVKAGCLCLVECKDVAPYPSLLLDNEKEVLRTVTHREKGYMGWVNRNLEIQKFFAEPQNLLRLARDKHFDPKQIKRILGFIVSNRPVFVYLTPDMFLTGSIPKVMVKEELQILLSEDWHNILPEALTASA
ncbi:MAG: hypothetical protein IMF11_01360 [Proteobacteria bacterium]|nr:hypothetical protein [Pseudomonadota bacterium]